MDRSRLPPPLQPGGASTTWNHVLLDSTFYRYEGSEPCEGHNLQWPVQGFGIQGFPRAQPVTGLLGTVLSMHPLPLCKYLSWVVKQGGILVLHLSNVVVKKTTNQPRVLATAGRVG
jgi:hypothetical protein